MLFRSPATIPPVLSTGVPSHVRIPALASRVTEPQAVTPRKRKYEDSEGGIPKAQSPHRTPINHPVPPRKDLSSLPRIPKKGQVYVEVPSRPTAWKGQISTSQPPVIREYSATTDAPTDDGPATAGPTTQYRKSSAMSITDGRASPVKRTGGRDERGALFES